MNGYPGPYVPVHGTLGPPPPVTGAAVGLTQQVECVYYKRTQLRKARTVSLKLVVKTFHVIVHLRRSPGRT